MDLRHLDAEPSDDERAAVDAVLGAPAPSGWEGGERDETRLARTGHALRSQRHRLLPALHALNDRVGWISPGGLSYVCRRLMVAPADAYGVASFYAMFSLVERPAELTHVCTDVVCRAAGGPATAPPGTLAANCLGLCEQAPVRLVSRAGDPPEHRIAAERSTEPVPERGVPLLARAGAVDPTSLDDYRRLGGYEALRRALAIGPAGVIREVAESGLAGRGGAAFPTGRKWQAVAANPARPHYLVCNADESEPGTFKDRVMIELDPFALVEALTVAAYAVGAEHAYVYLRGEYSTAHERLAHALVEARRRGLLGRDVMGGGFDLDIEIVRGAGAYICGEETALFNSIEGFRGEPRSKPPFPVDAGLFGRPTAINNVETLLNVLPILTGGGAAYARVGTEGSTGTRLFCLSGNVARPGVYEAPFGLTLRELLERAGGVAGGRPLQAVLLGGAAGAFVGPHQLDLELSIEGARAAGATLGSGVVVVLDDTVDVAGLLLRIAAFFRDESCGQCVPCRVGTVRQEEALARLVAAGGGGDEAGERALLADLGQVMREASICGLGQTAASAVQSALVNLEPFRGGTR